MKHSGFMNQGLHHKQAKRADRDRDGQDMPVSGQAKTKEQCYGYSGSDGKGPPTKARKKGGGHMAAKY